MSRLCPSFSLPKHEMLPSYCYIGSNVLCSVRPFSSPSHQRGKWCLTCPFGLSCLNSGCLLMITLPILFCSFQYSSQAIVFRIIKTHTHTKFSLLIYAIYLHFGVNPLNYLCFCFFIFEVTGLGWCLSDIQWLSLFIHKVFFDLSSSLCCVP